MVKYRVFVWPALALVLALAVAPAGAVARPYVPPPSAPAPDLAPAVLHPDPVIQQMIDQVSAAAIQQYDGGLSGEWPVVIGGLPYTIQTRNTRSGTPIKKATEYVGEHLAGLGLDVEYHTWAAASYCANASCPNVIGELHGREPGGRIAIISAHLDDMPSGATAPGADDNASGATGVLIAADILTQYPWSCTLRFALWTGEEQGMLGSEAYAIRAAGRGENITGVLNLDMIGWDSYGTPDMDLHADSSVPGSLQLAQLFRDVVAAYGLDLAPEIMPNGIGASDHASFLDRGYPAVLAIEDYTDGDFNDYYHTVNDQIEQLNMAYFTDMVKASVATFAHMTGCLVRSTTYLPVIRKD